METPPRIKEQYSCWWWFMFTLLIMTCVGSLVALKVFDALITLFIAIWCYCMVKDRCAQMSQQCVFSFGLMCFIQAIMEFIILAMSLPGRQTRHTTVEGDPKTGSHAPGGPVVGSGSHQVSYTTTIKTTPFFDESQGWYYNFQSGMMVATVVVFALSAMLSKSTYSEYTTSLFDEPGESDSFGRTQQRGYGGGGHGGGGSVYQQGNNRFNPSNRGANHGPSPGGHQWGQGQRLGG